MKVLLVEDEKKIREGLASMIEESIPGIVVAGQAEHGKEALEWMKTHHVDVVITDIRMGEMNGIELLSRLRTLYPSLHVVIISGYSDFEYTKEAIRHGATDYLLKPVHRVELMSVMSRLYEQWKGEGEAVTEADEEDAEPSRRTIRKAKELILESLDQELSLQYLADLLYLHPKYLSVMFKKETGQNLSDYVTTCRIDKAKELLSQTNLKILEVAALCGFHNYRYFMTVFKQRTGQTPTEFRNEIE